jgi:hypothetical protein
MLHFCVKGVVVVLAIILFASVAEEMLIAELAVADTGFEPLLLMCRRLSHRTVDTLAVAIDGNASRVSWQRAISLGGTGIGRGDRSWTLWGSDGDGDRSLLHR